MKLAVLITFVFVTPAFAQYADEIARREAIQHFRTGIERLEAGAFEQAAAAFLRAISRDKNLPIAYYGLGQAYMARQRYEDAIVAFVHAIDSLAAANLYAGDRQPELWQHTSNEAQRERREALNRTTGNGTDALRAQNMAADRMRTIVSQQGRSFEAEISMALGSALYHTNKLPEAEGEWRRAVELRPDFGEAWNNLAALYAQTGHKAPAVEALKSAKRAGFKIDPGLEKQIREMR